MKALEAIPSENDNLLSINDIHVGIRYTHPRNSAKARNKACEPAERYRIISILHAMNRRRSLPTELDEVALRNVKKQTKVFRMSEGQGTPARLTLANIRGALRSTARP